MSPTHIYTVYIYWPSHCTAFYNCVCETVIQTSQSSSQLEISRYVLGEAGGGGGGGKEGDLPHPLHLCNHHVSYSRFLLLGENFHEFCVSLPIAHPRKSDTDLVPSRDCTQIACYPGCPSKPCVIAPTRQHRDCRCCFPLTGKAEFVQ